MRTNSAARLEIFESGTASFTVHVKYNPDLYAQSTIVRLVENPLARAIVAGEFKPGDHVVADADPVSGTLVFSTASATVVSEGRPKRDARARRVEPATPVPGSDRLN